MTDQLRIVMAQLNLLVGDVEGNARIVIEAAHRARDEMQADAIVFPELTLCGYPPEDLLYREELYRRIDEQLMLIGQSVRDIDVILGYPEYGEEGIYNAALHLSNGDVLGRYRKHELPNYSVFDEKRYFRPGSEACVTSIKGVPVGLTICEDIWMHGPAAAARQAGARLLINLNASPFELGKGDERIAIVRQRAAETGLPVVYVNLVGGQDELVFDGASFVLDADGELTQLAPACEEGLFLTEFTVDDTLKPLPGEIVKPVCDEETVYQALVLGVRDYVEKNGFQGAVLGLSGGIDSALVAAVAADALGPERVEVVLMPSRYTADMSNEDAELEAQHLGIDYQTIAIEPMFQAFSTALADTFAGTQRDTTEENIQARCRGVILMAISNKRGRILLTTGNKSEMSVGYATLYGDMAGGFAPIKDVPKTLVYRLSKWRNEQGEVIPPRVIERPPSAELAPDQKDEDSLPPYEVLDPILQYHVEQDMSVPEIVAKGYDEDTVRHVVHMVDRNEYKRRQAPPGVRITGRAFGRDRRYPLTSGYGRNRH